MSVIPPSVPPHLPGKYCWACATRLVRLWVLGTQGLPRPLPSRSLVSVATAQGFDPRPPLRPDTSAGPAGRPGVCSLVQEPGLALSALPAVCPQAAAALQVVVSLSARELDNRPQACWAHRHSKTWGSVGSFPEVPAQVLCTPQSTPPFTRCRNASLITKVRIQTSQDTHEKLDGVTFPDCGARMSITRVLPHSWDTDLPLWPSP